MFHPALGLRNVGADNVDVHLIKRPAKLRQAAGWSEGRRACRYRRPAACPLLQIRLRRMQIVERILRSGKAKIATLSATW